MATQRRRTYSREFKRAQGATDSPKPSRTGNCYDNALVESFFATLKVERVHHQRYASFAQAKQDIFCYIAGFYNRRRRRRHSSLGYLSPDEFECRHTQVLN